MKLKAASGYACYAKDLDASIAFYQNSGLKLKSEVQTVRSYTSTGIVLILSLLIPKMTQRHNMKPLRPFWELGYFYTLVSIMSMKPMTMPSH